MVKKMARRKKQNPIEELIGILFVMIVLGVYYLNKSWGIAFSVGIIYIVGVIIIFILIETIRKAKLRESGIEEIDNMTGIQFEKYLMVLFQDLGYLVKSTPKTGDFGADLILQKDKRKIVVQAKKYKKNVGIKAVQEVTSAIKYYNANEAWVVTNSFFTIAAIELSESNHITLIHRDKLMDLIISNKKQKKMSK